MAASGSATPVGRYQFADLILDLGRRRLARGDDPIPLSKLTFELLRVLVEQAPNVVAHEDLARRTWGARRIVTPECLAKRVMLLRQALGDDAERPRYVERVRGQGYRLVPEVRRIDASPEVAGAEPHASVTLAQDVVVDEASASTPSAASAAPSMVGSHRPGARWLGRLGLAGRVAMGAAVLLVGAAGWIGARYIGPDRDGARALAVLPFENRSAAEEDAGFFAEGIHDELISRLASIEDLKVAPRASVMDYRDPSMSRRRVGEELGVDVVLDGSVQRAGDMVRVTVHLVDTHTDKTLWGESYDEALTAGNVFAIQRRIATTIAQELKAKLTLEEETRLGETPTQNMRALDLYLSGRDYERPPFAYWGMAARQYERAVAEDPAFALAHARLSIASLLAFYNIDWKRERIETARRAAEEAVRLQPNLPVARVAMAFYLLSVGGSVERAAEELAIAQPHARNEPQFFLVRSMLNERLGKREEAMADRAAALALSPRDPVLMLDVAQWHARVREHDEAARLVERALDIRPDFKAAEMFKAELALLRDGNPAPIRALSMDDFRNDPGRFGRLRHLQWLGALYERDFDRAIGILNELDRAMVRGDDQNGGDGGPRPPALPYVAAMAGTLLAAGESDAAREISRSGLERIGTGPEWRVWRAAFLVGAGETDEAVKLALDVLAESPPDEPFTNDLRLWILFDVLAASRASTEAIDVLEQYLSRPGNWSIEGLLPDPRLDAIRRDARFGALVAKHRRRDVVQVAERTEPASSAIRPSIDLRRASTASGPSASPAHP